MSDRNGFDPRDDGLTSKEILEEISRIRDRMALLDGSRSGGHPVQDFQIHPMPIANRDRREYFLFYDLFIHSDRRKLTAVAPYYGDDFDFGARGIDLDAVVIEIRGARIEGKRISYGTEGWEPSVLFDFEDPKLPGWISEFPELEVRVCAGEAERTFWIDTRPPTPHSIALALCVRDENRWLGNYLSYYLDLLRVDHVYVYDNRTRDRHGLKTILAPYVENNRATYIPWNFEWRNRIDRKQIGQPPQEAHTLARFGADRWIGFFDADEFLHIPGGDLARFLEEYDPGEIGAVAFKMRWAMYKGERVFADLHQPLTECVYGREDEYWEKRWKLFVSPERVRFMRFHWIQEDQPTVHRPDVLYYHYLLRDFRFEEGKGDTGLGSDTFRDETMREVWETHDFEPSPIRGDASRTNALVAHVESSFQRARRSESNLTAEAAQIPGMIGTSTRHFFNNLCSEPDTRLLEIGSWQGASSCAFLCGNRIRATLVDNWSEWGNHRDLCIERIESFRGSSAVRILERDCFELRPDELETYNLYYYDGHHSEDAQYRGVTEFYRYLEDTAVLIVDDWNWRRVRAGTERALKDISADVVYSRELTVPEAPRDGDGKLTSDPRTWWNGIACFVLQRRA